MAPTEGGVTRPERRWDCRRGTPTVHPRAKVTIDSLQEVVYEKSIGTKMNDLDLDLCLEVV